MTDRRVSPLWFSMDEIPDAHRTSAMALVAAFCERRPGYYDRLVADPVFELVEVAPDRYEPKAGTYQGRIRLTAEKGEREVRFDLHPHADWGWLDLLRRVERHFFRAFEDERMRHFRGLEPLPSCPRYLWWSWRARLAWMMAHPPPKEEDAEDARAPDGGATAGGGVSTENEEEPVASGAGTTR